MDGLGSGNPADRDAARWLSEPIELGDVVRLRSGADGWR